MDQSSNKRSSVRLTREELYERVWTRPMIHVAADLGITGNGLAKICDRLKVPYPPRGYWAKKQSGKKVVVYRLPEREAGSPVDAVIAPTPPSPQVPELPPEAQEVVDEAKSQAASIGVPDTLTKPHKLVAKWLTDHAEKKRKARHERDPWRTQLYDPGELTDRDHRQHRIFDTLFKALEARGAKIAEGERRTLYAELDGEKIEFAIREKQKQIRRQPTEAQKNDIFFRTQTLEPTGRLLFAIKTYLPSGLRREWLETEEKPLELLLPDIVVTFLTAAPILAAQTRERKEAERQRRIAEQKRYEEQQRRKLESNRFRCLGEFAERSRRAEQVREFLARLKAMEFDPQMLIDGRSVPDWIAWAENYADELDPLNASIADIFETVAEVKSWTYSD